MAWTKVERITQRGVPRLASVRLTKSDPSRPAMLTVRIAAGLGTQAGIAKGEAFDVMIGSGEHAGLLRLTKNPDGLAIARYHHQGADRQSQPVIFSLGHIKEFPDIHMKRVEACFARVIDDAIEVQLPEGITGIELPRTIVTSEEAPAAAARAPANGGMAGEPTIDLGTNHLIFAGQKIELGKRVAVLLDPLATHFGKAVRKADLIKLVWGENPPDDQNYYQLVKRANDQINPIGLEVFKLRTNGTAACMLRSTEAA